MATDIAIGSDRNLVPAHTINNARQLALISLISPILYMASLVGAAILSLSELGRSSQSFYFWLVAQCFICAALFLASLREKAVMFDEDMVDRDSQVIGFSIVAIGLCWGIVPGLLAFTEPAAPYLVFGAVLSGLTMSATLMLKYMPRFSMFSLAVIAGGFMANTIFQPDLLSTTLSIIMLAYFGVLVFCSRWYYARFDQRLNVAEELAGRERELNSLLKDVGQTSNTHFWRTDSYGLITEISDPALFYRRNRRDIIGSNLVELFTASKERDLLKARVTRRSEIVALELEVSNATGGASRWWKLSARPVFENGEFTGFRGAASDITDLRRSERRAAFLTEYDSLTGLLNRASFYSAVELRLDQPFAQDMEGGILWIDLDNFKWINDTFGHAGGDDALKSVAHRLETICQEDDIVCRFGGDEFAVLAVRPREGDELQKFVAHLTHTLSAPYRLDNSEVQCSASVGFRRIGPNETDATSLMKEADLALYSAKSDGRAIWKEYSEAFKAKVRGQRELAQDLEKAIGTDELGLEFQPIVDGMTGEVVAVEALSRWQHPTRGTISPTNFIAVAESNGLIIKLGDTIVAKAIEAAVKLPPNIRVGINISPLQIHSSALLDLIERKLAETGVEPGRIELEITESVFLSDNSFVLDRLRHLKRIGLRIVLDDFGTGFSSLAYLQRFPFDKLKLDQAFVRGIETSDQSCAIARATISMAHALDLTVTAEGVETAAQADFLREQGCDELQGYLYALPQSEKALAAFVDGRIDGFGHTSVIDDPKVVSLNAGKFLK